MCRLCQLSCISGWHDSPDLLPKFRSLLFAHKKIPISAPLKEDKKSLRATSLIPIPACGRARQAGLLYMHIKKMDGSRLLNGLSSLFSHHYQGIFMTDLGTHSAMLMRSLSKASSWVDPILQRSAKRPCLTFQLAGWLLLNKMCTPFSRSLYSVRIYGIVDCVW